YRDADWGVAIAIVSVIVLLVVLKIYFLDPYFERRRKPQILKKEVYNRFFEEIRVNLDSKK
ncbi:MAG: hypothetical protein NWQ09_06700, partial [Nonlabens sp.]|nr:hypothetical protein [Nonlabens sp.]